jgi:hypothetical protein
MAWYWWLLIVFVVAGIISLAIDEDNWETVASGTAEYVLFGGTCAIVIQQHKKDKTYRAYQTSGEHKKSIDVDYACQMIGWRKPQ